MSTFFSWLGVKVAILVGGFVGAVVSLKFVAALDKISWFQRTLTVLGGWAAAAFLTPLSIEWFELSLSDKSQGGIAFLIGLFGLSIMAALMESIPDITKALRAKAGV